MSILFLSLSSVSFASTIDITHNSDAILEHSRYVVSPSDRNFTEIRKYGKFMQSQQRHINLGFVRGMTLWIRLDVVNKTEQTQKRFLEIQNPLLESVELYSNSQMIGKISSLTPHNTINQYFVLHLKPLEQKTYYLKVQNQTTALRLGLALKDEKTLLHGNYRTEIIIYILFTIVCMLFVYNMILFIFTKEKTYIYYSFYLMSVLFQQATYLGITQMFMPEWFNYYDNLSVLLKVNLMHITAALFAKSFLQTKRFLKINKIYNSFIIFSVFEIPLFGTPLFYYPEVGIVTAIFFIIFNLFAAVYIYKNGYKQARLFIIAWSFLVLGFMLMILDGLGFISVMQNINEIILFLITFEAIILSLAFVDRYRILRNEKEEADRLLLQEYESRHAIIQNEIQKQTKELNELVRAKHTLLKELQHRTKNNLQLILSLVRIQSDKSSTQMKEKLQELENRIGTIAKTQQMFYMKENMQKINMGEYIHELCNDLEKLSKKELIIKIETRNIYMGIKEAGYIGLIINEIVTNSIKYVELARVVIVIDLHKSGSHYHLNIQDNGAGFDLKNFKSRGMGIELIKTLVENQLDGDLEIKVNHGLIYNIGFSL